jgi:hypothetical protein
VFTQLDEKETAAYIEREMKQSGLPRSSVERAIKLKQDRDRQAVWLQWLLVLVAVAAGVVTGVMATRGIRDWPYYVSMMSFVYLGGWLLSLFGNRIEPHTSILDAYIFNMMNSFSVDSFLSPLSFLHRNLLLPAFHFFVGTFVLYKRSEFSQQRMPKDV